MTTGFRETIGLHAQALVLRERRNAVLASNIANAATPNYLARDFDVQLTLAKGPGRATGQAGLAQVDLGYRQPVTPSLDGNTVEIGVEQMEFSENTLRYQTSLQFLNRRISGLMTAIKGE